MERNLLPGELPGNDLGAASFERDPVLVLGEGKMNLERLLEKELSPKVWFKKWRELLKLLLFPEELDPRVHLVEIPSRRLNES